MEHRIFSADSHLEISPERWTVRVPAKYRDRAPRLIKWANGGDGVIVEGRPLYAGRRKDQILSGNVADYFQFQ